MELSLQETIDRQKLIRSCIDTNYIKLIKFFANSKNINAKSGYAKATLAYFSFCQTQELTISDLEQIYLTTREALKFINKNV